MKQIFPIKSDTACLLKWTWSTVFLNIGTTSSCHRVNHDKITVDTFDSFHNTPRKIATREMMRQGEWPKAGCEYCQKIEEAGGVSDRQFQLSSMHYEVPDELLEDNSTNVVTPKILEVYFSNTCNMSCLYCGPHFSSMWEAENNRFGNFQNKQILLKTTEQVGFNKEYDQMREKFFQWLEKHGHGLQDLHILGGEPFHQPELEMCLDFFEKFPAPNMRFTLISNLKVNPNKFKNIINKMIKLKQDKKIKELQITGSLDCWGPQQEYIRYGLDLNEYTANMEYLLDKDIVLCVNAAINALSIKTMPEYIAKINEWNTIRLASWNNDPKRKISFSFMTANAPPYMMPDIFVPGLFKNEFEQILNLMPRDTDYQNQNYEHMTGIYKQVDTTPANNDMIETLKIYLDEIDRRRNTNWRSLFPWLEEQ